jgi:hypothetical protein
LTGRRVLRHLQAGGALLAFTVAWTWPLATRLSTHLPGSAFGDNVAFLWNVWWMRTALAAGLDVFHTAYLFAPAGTDLTLHTHTALPALFGATVLGAWSFVTAHNVVILAAVFLNGLCAYWLAWRTLNDHGAAIVAGIVFAGSPYIAARLQGHFNLVHAWTIPLFAVAALPAVAGSTRAAVCAGGVLGLTAYVDYYYVIYQAALAVCLALVTAIRCDPSWRPTPRSRRAALMIGTLVLLDIAVIAAIVASGGFDARIAGVRISAHDTFNPLQALWVLLAVFVLLRSGFRVAVRGRGLQALKRAAAALAITGAAGVAVALPLVWKAGGVLLRGDYVAQRYLWRSAPKGVDVASLVLGNPFHGLWGESVRAIYHRLGIDPMEASGWLGLVPAALAIWAIRRYAKSAVGGDPLTVPVRTWTIVAAVFLVWALGPHLMAFGVNTGMILPQTALRYVPLAAETRIPGRAIVLVHLSLAVLTAVATARWSAASGRRRLVPIAVALAVAADGLAAPLSLVALQRPRIFETLRVQPERGAVLEIPFGLRDGYGVRGASADRALFHQTIHERPIVGGFVARLAPSVIGVYERDPLLSALLRADGGVAADVRHRLPAPEVARARLRADGIAFIVIDRNVTPAALSEYVERELWLTAIAGDDRRTVYRVASSLTERR